MGKIVSSVLGINQYQPIMPSYTARDILPETKMADPQAPLLGGLEPEDSELDRATKVQKSRYTSNSLLIQQQGGNK